MRSVLITGGSRGIGKAICKRYAEEGCEIGAPSHAKVALDNADSMAAYIERNRDRISDTIVNNADFADIHGVTNASAVELAPYHILANTVCPGFTATELTCQSNTTEQISAITADIPLRCMTNPSKISNAVCFVGSERNIYLTGQKISADGGFSKT